MGDCSIGRWRRLFADFGCPYGQITGVTHFFDIGSGPQAISVGKGKLFLIAGPCVLESEKHARKMADAIQRITADLGVPYIFKASYDKANRTSITSFRGPGLVEGCRILRAIGKDTGLPVLTDVHTPQDCGEASEVLGDVGAGLQIPAFLCRQTDLLIAAAETGRGVNMKKGQFVCSGGYGACGGEDSRDSGNERVC